MTSEEILFQESELYLKSKEMCDFHFARKTNGECLACKNDVPRVKPLKPEPNPDPDADYQEAKDQQFDGRRFY